MKPVPSLELGQTIAFLDKKAKNPDHPNAMHIATVIGMHPHNMLLSRKYWVTAKKCQSKVGIYYNAIFNLWTEYEGPQPD